MSSIKRKFGTLIIDHRFSPGIPAGIARASGFDPRHCGEGGYFEAHTITCPHCRTAFVAVVGADYEYCRGCDNYLCEGCALAAAHPDYKHRPAEKVIDAILSDKRVYLPYPPPLRGGQNG